MNYNPRRYDLGIRPQEEMRTERANNFKYPENLRCLVPAEQLHENKLYLFNLPNTSLFITVWAYLGTLTLSSLSLLL